MEWFSFGLGLSMGLVFGAAGVIFLREIGRVLQG